MNQIRDVVVIVPAYNAARTIRQTLESIQTQQHGLDRADCVLVVDDASTDDTIMVARACWRSPIPLLVTRHTRNQGERTTVNDAIETLAPQVQWFFILHSDDIAKPCWLEVMLRGIDQATATTVGLTASYDVLFPDGRVIQGEDLGEHQKVIIQGSAEAIRGTLRRGCWFKISSCAIRVAAFRELRGFQAAMPQLGDWEFVLRAFREGWTIEYIPLSLSVYRQSLSSVSSKSFRDHKDVSEALIVINRFSEYLSVKSLLARHVYYLYVLTRRLAASVAHGQLERATRAGVLWIRVAGSLCLGLWRRQRVATSYTEEPTHTRG